MMCFYMLMHFVFVVIGVINDMSIILVQVC